MSVVLTVRLEKALKERLRRYGINVSQTVREILEQEVKKREMEELAKTVGEMKHLLTKIPDNEIVRIVKESRDQR
jgi:predicted DNA-binding protein